MNTQEETFFFEALCKQYYQRVFQYILIKTNNRAIAEDLVQNVFVVAWEKRLVLVNHQKPLAFLYVTAQNLVFSYLREVKKAPIPFPAFYEPKDTEGDALAVLEREADVAIDETVYVDEVLAALPREAQELYRDFYALHLSTKEIAKKNKVSEVSLRMRLVRLRKRVKKEVEKKNLKNPPLLFEKREI